MNRKAQWMWIVSAAIAIMLLVISWMIAGKSLGFSKKNIDVLQSCEGRQGHCAPENGCKATETAFFKALGCGDKEEDPKKYCCIPNAE